MHAQAGQLPLSAVILAGGRGERLGQDKASLVLEGQTLVQRLVAQLARLSDDVITVQRDDQTLDVPGARRVTDLPPYQGALAGIAAGLEAARHAWAILVACDMPFLNIDLLRYMASLREGYDAVVPRLNVGLEPLHALYHKRCLPALRQALATGQRRVISFYAPLTIRYVAPDKIHRLDPDERSFYNINTPEDLAQAQAWLRCITT